MAPKTLDPVTPAAPAANGHKSRKLLSRADILSAVPTHYEDVPTDEWGEGTAMRVRAMDFDTRDMWELAQIAFVDDKSGESFRGLRAKIVARCVIDESGKRLFTDADVAQFEKLDAAPIARAWKAIQRLSKVDTIEDEVEEAVKNSDGSPSGGRSTG